MKHFASKPIIFLCIIILPLALQACETDIQGGNCQYGSELRSAVRNNIIYRDKIEKTFLACLDSSNKNRDVTSNDSNEVIKSCKKMAFDLYGGVISSNYASDAYIPNIQADIQACEGLK